MIEANKLVTPPGWAKTTLGEIVEPRRGKANPQASPDKHFIGMEQVEAHTMRLLGTVRAGEMKSAANVFECGDVLYGRLRPYLNKVIQPDFSGLCSGEFIVLPESRTVSGRFLKYRLNAPDFVRFASRINTGDRPRVDFDQLKGFELLLPPRNEQDRICDAIEEILSDLGAGVTSLEVVQKKLEHYRAAVLKAAVEGLLTAEWRRQHPDAEPASELLMRILAERRRRWEEEQLRRFAEAGKEPPKDWKEKYKEPRTLDTSNLPLLPDGWCWVMWSQIGFSQNGRPFPSSEYQDSGVKLLRPGNLFANGSVTWTERNTRSLPEKYAEASPDLLVRGGELVINLTAQSLKDDFLGRVCMTSEGEYCLLNQRLARLTPILALPRFMLWLFKSTHFRKFVASLNTGSLIQHMFTSQIEEFALPLPPLAEQEQIASEVEAHMSVIDATETQAATLVQRTTGLRQSILRHAFTGQLVPQDPDDDPASELLKRISAEREGRKRQTASAKRSASKQRQPPSAPMRPVKDQS
jgi:type I restriction enzyme, S subunit